MRKLLALIVALPLTVFAAAQEKIVSLGGDVTEIVYALGAESSLVARDSTSQWPQPATTLPDVGYLRQLNAEGILAMRPTLVLASAQAQPSLALKQVEQSNVGSSPCPAVTISVLSTKGAGDCWKRPIALSKVMPCVKTCVRRWRRCRRLRLINGCCSSSITAG